VDTRTDECHILKKEVRTFQKKKWASNVGASEKEEGQEGRCKCYPVGNRRDLDTETATKKNSDDHFRVWNIVEADEGGNLGGWEGNRGGHGSELF